MPHCQYVTYTFLSTSSGRMAAGTSLPTAPSGSSSPSFFRIGLQTVILERERIVIVAQIIAERFHHKLRLRFSALPVTRRIKICSSCSRMARIIGEMFHFLLAALGFLENRNLFLKNKTAPSVLKMHRCNNNLFGNPPDNRRPAVTAMQFFSFSLICLNSRTEMPSFMTAFMRFEHLLTGIAPVKRHVHVFSLTGHADAPKERQSS